MTKAENIANPLGTERVGKLMVRFAIVIPNPAFASMLQASAELHINKLEIFFPILTPKAYAAEGLVRNYIENLNGCLVQKIPKHSLEGLETGLRTILGNIQQGTLRRTV